MNRILRMSLALCAALAALAALYVGATGARAEETGAYGSFEYKIYDNYDRRVCDITGATGSGTVTVPDQINGAPVVGIRSYAFQFSEAEAVILPESVEFIDTFAFYGCGSLTSITITSPHIEIQQNAFWQTPLENLYLEDLEAFLGGLGVSENGVTGYDLNWYVNGELLTEFSPSAALTEIPYGAFRHCASLQRVTLPATVRTVDSGAFRDCASLTDLVLNEGVRSIGMYAFEGCAALKTVSLPDSVTSLENSAFARRQGLTSVRLSAGLTSIGGNAFSGIDDLANVTLPEHLVTLGEGAFDDCKRLERLYAPESLDTFTDRVIDRTGLHKNFKVYCYQYSEMGIWVKENNAPHVYIDDMDLKTLRSVSVWGEKELYTGQTCPLFLDYFPAADKPAVVWSSSNPSVATVKDGWVTGVSGGAADISVTVGRLKGSTRVTVIPVFRDFSFAEPEAWIAVETAGYPVEVVIEPAGATAELTWSVDDGSVAVIDPSTGYVTGRKPGDVTVTVSSANGVSHSCALHVTYPVTAVAFAPRALTLAVHDTTLLTANVTTRSGSLVNRLVRFASSDSSVAVVDARGNLRALKAGTATITATAGNGVADSCTVTVRALNTLRLPKSLLQIGEEAFVNGVAEEIFVPGTCTAIGARAFSGCAALRAIHIPASVKTIGAGAFTGCGQVVIYCPEGSAAWSYAAANGLPREAE